STELEFGRPETGKGGGGVGGVALLALALIGPQLAKRHAETKEAWDIATRTLRLKRGEVSSPHAASIGAMSPEELTKWKIHKQLEEGAREWDWFFDLLLHPS